jgi:EAL domain-containing protein (putative c-di-GMP-specific phosphodiesterase class I)
VRYSPATVIRGLHKGTVNMQRQGRLAILGVVIFSLFAAGCAVFIVTSGTWPAHVVAAAVLLLAAGQVAASLVHWSRHRDIDEYLAENGHALESYAQESSAISARLDRVEQLLARPVANPAADLLKEMKTLRDSFQAMAKDMAKPPETPVAEPVEAPKPQAGEPPVPANEHLEFLLEPVIELATGTTAHYRARVNMVGDRGTAVLHADLMRKAGEGGMRAALDVHLLKLALPVLRRLRNKHPAMRMLVPLGAATLRAEQELARVIQLLEGESGAAGGIVFEIAHGDLAGLEAAGIAGLARLGRLGATMALSGVTLAGLDLASLRQLGVRFLDIDAADFDSGFGIASSWTEFAQFARAMQFQIIGGAVATSVQATAATRIARFGYGPYFAPPRRVRADAGQPAAASRTRAA